MPIWFRKGPSPHRTALAMIGAKAGDHVVIAGAHDPELAAAVARITGLNGQTTVFDDRAGAQQRIEAAARDAGALIDFEPAAAHSLPLDAAARDIVVLVTRLEPMDDARRLACVQEAIRVLRPGGRVIIVDGARRAGLSRVLPDHGSRLQSEDALALLERAGAKAKRQLADVDGVAFYEGRK